MQGRSRRESGRRRARPCYVFGVLIAFIAASTVLAAPPAAKGDSWESLAKVHYGSEHYGPLLALYNDSAGKKLPLGAKVNVPGLEAGVAMLRMEGAFEGLVRHIANAGTALAGVQEELKAHAAKKSGDKTALPGPIGVRLQKVANYVDNARSGAAATEERYDPPQRAIGELQAASEKLAQLKQGKISPTGEDVQRIHKHLADAMLEVIRWYRAGFR